MLDLQSLLNARGILSVDWPAHGTTPTFAPKGCWTLVIGDRMTFRKELLALLSDQPRSASWLARELGLPRTTIEEDLRHAIRSARTAGHRVQVLAARCKSCGFEFDPDRLAKPGKCPACKGSRIYEAQILVGTAT